MIIQLSELAEIRNYEFPITIKKVFLAHAAASPLPRRVAEAMTRYIEESSTEGQWEYLYGKTEEATRCLAARLIGASPEEIAFVSSTSMGLSLVASGIPWREGDNVIIADGDFPANIYPWLNLRSRGVKVKFIPRHSDGSVTLEDVQDLADARTRLVSLSSVNYISGYRIDISAIGQFLQSKGILFCVDAIQSLGVLPLDVAYIDYLACGAHKWLLGPLGTGILYVKKRHIPTMSPALNGWKCVRGYKNYLEYDLCYQESAKRLEPGGMNIAGIMGLHAALELLLETGIENIAEKLTRFRRIIKPALLERDFDLVSPVVDCWGSGIISFTSPDVDIPALRQKLDDSGYVVSLREGLDGLKCIRISPHFYNTEDEVRQFLEMLSQR